jgi:pyruvate formate-lyase/glycerol dehydratase family glycyl radical enzyme
MSVLNYQEIDMIDEVAPWWERSTTYRNLWKGTLFDRMILRDKDEEELRILKLREMLLERPQGKRGYLSVWRAKLMTDSYRQTDGEAPILRKAKAFKHLCEHIPLLYFEHQLLLGDPSALFLAAEIEPEFFSKWMDRDIFLKEVEKTLSQLDAIQVRGAEGWDIGWVISEEDIKTLAEYIIPYWRGICLEHVIEKQIQENYPYVKFKDGDFVGRASHPIVGHGLSHTIADYASVLQKGLKGLKEEIRAEMDKIDGSDVPSSSCFDKLNVYKAMLIAADSIIIYSNRCADLAEEMLAKERDAKRKSELLEIARVCRKVPEYPAESWWEAIQSWHFLHNSLYLCDGGTVHSAGRFDQYMYPYLKSDLERGNITRKTAQVLLECLFIKIAQGKYLRVKIPAAIKQDKLTIGGIDSNGQDSTNELTWMILEAHAHCHMDDPYISFRVHKNTPDSILKATLELLRVGTGFPMLINDEAIIPSLLNRGLTLEEARDYTDMGCQESSSDPNMSGADTNPRANAGYFNLPKMVLFAIYNGVDKVSGQEAGPRTGNPGNFKSMEAFFTAVKEQIDYHVQVNCVVNNLMDWAYVNWHPVPVIDLLHPGPRKSGIDYENGGCKYNWTGAIGVGLGTAADSLAAIEWLVYDKKALTFDQLIDTLDNNWVGYEYIREEARKAPKYGNDDDYADKWAVRISNAWMDAYEKHRTSHGGIFVGGFFSMANYVPMGGETWATPEGRKQGEPLSSGMDPVNGADLLGPTKTHKSAAKIDTLRTTNGITFNCKFPTAAVSSEREIAKWADLLRTYMLLGGQSVQYTVVNGEALKDAQKHPEQYKDLIVRTGGYSAFFVDLTKEIQDTIITRTEHNL